MPAVLLYGSFARHDAGPDSDIDLLVVWKDEIDEAHAAELLDEAVTRIERLTGNGAQIIAMTGAELDGLMERRDPLIDSLRETAQSADTRCPRGDTAGRSLMPARTRPMTRADASTRQRHAHAFLNAANLVIELGDEAGIPDIGNTVGSLAVLAGIAAGDAICGATLGQRAAGESHGEAVALLRRSERGKRPRAVARSADRVEERRAICRHHPHRNAGTRPAQGRATHGRRDGRDTSAGVTHARERARDGASTCR